MDPRREYALALGLLAGGGALALAAAQAQWITAAPAGDGASAIGGIVFGNGGYSGTEVTPWVAPLAIVAIVGAVAVIATRGVLRRVVSLVLATVGVGLVLAPVMVILDPGAAATGPVRSATGGGSGTRVQVDAVAWWWCWLAALGGLLVLAGAALVFRSGSRWAVMASRYEAPRAATGSTASAASADASEPAQSGEGSTGRRQDAWSRLDRGEDPTVDDAGVSE